MLGFDRKNKIIIEMNALKEMKKSDQNKKKSIIQGRKEKNKEIFI